MNEVNQIFLVSYIYHMEVECVNILLLCKEQCATENCQSEFYIIHSMHYSYNQSHLQTNTH